MFRDIYIDESSQTASRYLLLGALTVPSGQASAAQGRLLQAMAPELRGGEMKWGKVSRAKLPAYLRLADCFFDAPEFASAHFHSIVVDTSRLDHHRFNGGSSEVGFNKEIYQLATKCARVYPAHFFYINLDYRDTPQRPEDLRTILNMGRRKARDQRDWPFRRCQFRDSKTTPLLWLSDIFSGSLAFHLNGHRGKPEASPARCALSDHVLRRARIRNPSIDTALSGKFTIWHRQLQ